MNERVELSVVDLRQHLDAYPAPDGEGEDTTVDDGECHYFYWDRKNRWGQEERLVLWLHADKVRWFLKKRKNKKMKEERGDFVPATIECVDMIHKFFQDEEEEVFA